MIQIGSTIKVNANKIMDIQLVFLVQKKTSFMIRKCQVNSSIINPCIRSFWGYIWDFCSSSVEGKACLLHAGQEQADRWFIKSNF